MRNITLHKIKVPVSPDDFPRAIARSDNWIIGPKEDVALNILGLTTQVKKCSMNDLVLNFKTV